MSTKLYAITNEDGTIKRLEHSKTDLTQIEGEGWFEVTQKVVKGDSVWNGSKFIEADQPYPSWTADENGLYQPPTAYPNDGKDYTWNESTTSWDEVA